MSREEPKLCTCGSWKPAAASLRAHRVDIDRWEKVACRAHAAGEVDRQVQAAGREARRPRRSSARPTARTTPCVWP